jgi:membrane-associated phospholipid phosphatase
MRRCHWILVVAAALGGCISRGNAENSIARHLTDDGLPTLGSGLLAQGLSLEGRHDRTLLKGAEAAAATAVITDLLKRTVREPRPNGGDRASFPSGHTSFAFAMATVLADGQPKLGPYWYVLAAGVGWSRVDLRKHHGWDVIAGALLGHFIAREVIKLNGHSSGLAGVALAHRAW